MGKVNQKAVLVDLERCVGCRACEVACKEEHSLGPGVGPMVVVTVGPEEVEGKLRLAFVPVACRHCTDPLCLRACPVGALKKTDEGDVQHNPNLCIGCKMCLQVCPFGAMRFNPEKGTAFKCDLCIERAQKGEGPACVQTCPGKALISGDINELLQRKYKHIYLWALDKPVQF